MFDILVIGKGLMGAAALRHLTKSHPEMKVGVIGPDEPENHKTHTGVFSSHYDQGRITRVIDPSRVWATLAAHSIQRYAEIEEESGIRFYESVGCLRATDEDDFVALVRSVVQQFSPHTEEITSELCTQRYPYLSFSDSFVAWDEKSPAGYINPRSMVAAQWTVAQQNGAEIIREEVSDYQEQSDHIQINTRSGNTYRAKKILICAGGFTNLLLGRALDYQTRAHTILRGALPPDEVERLAGMPAIITRFENRDVPSMYMLPPIEYPDGQVYIKLGPSFRPEQLPLPEHYVQTADELREWFQSDGREDIAEALKDMLHRLIPNLKVTSYVHSPCLITTTAHGNPYIDVLVPGRIYVTTGGNGASAKSADEIGRIGAVLAATDQWDSELDREEFRLVWAD